ncbi:hypothetical protein CC2G_004969 [Coprinopsis cinerea AmutBmut pab1-1]|nr:hypothetical protein CC2G_004969 [Coprinopsis cinerea AmutBmut pab1-1]
MPLDSVRLKFGLPEKPTHAPGKRPDVRLKSRCPLPSPATQSSGIVYSPSPPSERLFRSIYVGSREEMEHHESEVVGYLAVAWVLSRRDPVVDGRTASLLRLSSRRCATLFVDGYYIKPEDYVEAKCSSEWVRSYLSRRFSGISTRWDALYVAFSNYRIVRSYGFD